MKVLLFAFLAACACRNVTAFDSTEIRLLQWPNDPIRSYLPKRAAKEEVNKDALTRFRKSSDSMSRAVRLDVLANPLIRFGKRSAPTFNKPDFSPLVRFGKRAAPIDIDAPQFVHTDDPRFWLMNRF